MTGPTSSPAVTTSATVHDDLRAQILRGDYAPGDALPSERALTQQLNVSRNAIREAIKRLMQAGLVEVAHGGKTRVKDWRTSGGLELLADLANAGATGFADLLRSAAEMRASIGSDAARLAAARADDRARAELRSQAAQLADEATLEAYERLWETLLEASGNLAYRLAYNSLVHARESGAVDARIYDQELQRPQDIAALAHAVADGDPARAYQLADALLNRTVDSLD